MSSAFALLCRELTDIQVRLLRRDGAASALAREALSLIYERRGCLRPSLYEQDMTDTSTFLRCCASILKHASSSEYALVHNVLLSTTVLANNYVNQVSNNTNELCHVLRSIIALNDCEKTFTSNLSAPPVTTESSEHKMQIQLKEEQMLYEESYHKTSNAVYDNHYSNNNTPINLMRTLSSATIKNNHNYGKEPNYSSLSSSNYQLCNNLEPNMLSLEQLITPTFQLAYDKWKRSSSHVHVISLLTLLNACSIVYGHTFHFTSMHTNMFGLLPYKNKMQMEAKLQRCYGARDILTALRDLELSRIDAGMCLACMADTGLYDPVVCDASCSELRANKELVTCQQLCEIVYHLGVLQHRHIHLSLFSDLIDAKKCNAEGVRRHAIGLAMLRQSPHNVKTFMDGIFLHALRAKHGQHQVKNKNFFQDSCHISPNCQNNRFLNSNGNKYKKWNTLNENNYVINYTDCNNNVNQERLREANVLSNSPILTSDSDYFLHPI